MSNDGGTVVPMPGPLVAPDATVGNGLDVVDLVETDAAGWDLHLRYLDADGERFDITIRCPDDAHLDTVLRAPHGFTFAADHVPMEVRPPAAGPAYLTREVLDRVAAHLGEVDPWLAAARRDASIDGLLHDGPGRPDTAELVDDVILARLAELAAHGPQWRDTIRALGAVGVVDWVLAVTPAELLAGPGRPVPSGGEVPSGEVPSGEVPSSEVPSSEVAGGGDAPHLADGLTVDARSVRADRGEFEGYVRMRIDPQVGARRRDCYLTRGALPSTYRAYVRGLQGGGAEAKAYFQNRTAYHPHSSNLSWQRLPVGRWDRVRPINPVRHKKHLLCVRNMSFNAPFVYEVQLLGAHTLHRNDVRL
ncbi:MAG: hypothetical protein S0880_00145 [Actinomycetota bacterium]|nr:hypothetical protein [Actinomycetota bacterium]